MNINKNKVKAQGVKENEEISKLKIIISEKEQIIQKLNSELELLKKTKTLKIQIIILNNKLKILKMISSN